MEQKPSYEELLEKNRLQEEKIKSLTEENRLRGEKIETLIEEKRILEEVAKIDALTLLYNRHKLDEIKEIKAGSTLVIMDLDYFKQINDTYGHPVGDKVLVLMARIIIENTRLPDIAIRYGGDEFVIIFRECAFDIVEAKCNKIAESFHLACEEVIGSPVTASIGKYFADLDTPTEEAIKVADDQLYVEKQKRHSY